MPFVADEQLADEARRVFGEYRTTFRSTTGQVRADLFRVGRVLQAHVSFASGLDPTSVTDPYPSELWNYARENGFPTPTVCSGARTACCGGTAPSAGAPTSPNVRAPRPARSASNSGGGRGGHTSCRGGPGGVRGRTACAILLALPFAEKWPGFWRPSPACAARDEEYAGWTTTFRGSRRGGRDTARAEEWRRLR